MVVTSDIELPTDEDLTVPEVNLSGSTLRAGAFHLGKFCEDINNEFMLCRFEEKDPRKCVNEGKAVTACTLDFFRAVKESCLDEFTQYATCLDKSSGDFAFKHCRKTQEVYDGCMLDKLEMPRPEFGYFCRARIHSTKRPKPEAPPKAIYPDATPGLPDDATQYPARYGARNYWTTE